MAYTVVQAGTTLYMVDGSGVATALTLPTGITLKEGQAMRSTRFGRYVVLANTPNRPITVDALGTVRPLVPFPPPSPHTIVDGGAGSLTGDYKTKQTFVIRDVFGNVIAESDFGPAQVTAYTATGDTISLSGLNLSSDDVSGSNIYRTLDGGEVYFLWRELDGNTQTTSDADDLEDLELSIFSAPTLGTPPDLTLIAEWRGRLWGVGRVDIDTLRYTEAGSMYAWPTSNGLSVPRIGSDEQGVTALHARRDSLVVGRKDVIKQVTGTSNRDFRVVGLADQTGILSHESVAVWKEVLYFLGTNGVYTLDGNEVKCISDGKTRSWFTTDTYFNRQYFPFASGYIDPVRLKYRLHLFAAGSVVPDRWIEYDIQTKTWWGPHKTDAFTPSVGFLVSTGASETLVPMIGSFDGYLSQDQSTATDWTSGIPMDVITGFDPQGSASTEKFWGRLSLIGKAQSAGTVQVTAYLGNLNAAAKLAMNYVMSAGTQVLGYLGIGALLKLRFQHSTAAEPVEIYGYEIEDVHELGNR